MPKTVLTSRIGRRRTVARRYRIDSDETSKSVLTDVRRGIVTQRPAIIHRNGIRRTSKPARHPNCAASNPPVAGNNVIPMFPAACVMPIAVPPRLGNVSTSTVNRVVPYKPTPSPTKRVDRKNGVGAGESTTPTSPAAATMNEPYAETARIKCSSLRTSDVTFQLRALGYRAQVRRQRCCSS